MGAWRGMVLLCSMALGCGGPLPEEAIQEDERPRAGSSREAGDEELTALWGRPELGTARLVKDIFPPFDAPPWLAPAPESLVEFRGRLYFAVNREDGHRGLWRSDGTAAGTVPVREFTPLPASFTPSTLTELTPLGSRLFFVVADEAHGQELWVSDGTSGGTRLVRDLTPGPGDSFPFNLTPVGRTLLFFRYVPDTPATPARTELWRSDGTEAGTVLVRDLGPESSLSASQALLGGTLLFVVSDPAHGTELWRTDGTEAGTVLVRDLHPGPGSSFPLQLRTVGRSVFFIAAEPTHGTGLWRTDGTAAGTVLVADLSPGTDSPFPRLLDAIGSCLYFTLSDPSDHRMRLYKLKVDAAGGGPVKLVATLPNPYAGQPDADPYITTSVVAGRKLFFGMGISTPGPAPRDVQLWVTDGTGSGTKLLYRPLSLSDEFESGLFALDDRILFSALEPSTGLEPWVSDGTVRGTRRLQELAPGGASSYPRGFTRVGDSVFFVAHDPAHGNELWVLPLRRSR